MKASGAAAVLSFDMGVRNLAACLVQAAQPTDNSGGFRVLHWEVLDLFPGRRAKAKPSISECNQRLQPALTSLLSRLPCQPTAVAIESQPAGRSAAVGNTRMKVLSHCVEAFCALRLPGVPVRFVAPRARYALCDPDSVAAACDKKLKASRRYTLRKRMCADACEAMLNQLQEPGWLQMYKEHSKRDDLADALLQGLSILNSS